MLGAGYASMLVPLTCDAPIYHWPFATASLIAANVLAYAALMSALVNDPTAAETLIDLTVLQHGNGLHPLEWVGSMFMHANFLHLAGNMLFLWIFGLVVEGKVGWWRMLLLYLGIGILQSAIEQVAMLGAGQITFSLGASSAIYGIMAIALVWAPKNEINCFYWFAFWAVGTVDVPIMYFCMFYMAFDILYMAIDFAASGSMMGTGLLHVMGALIGAPAGLLMLKWHLVDCEGWDLLHVWNGADPSAEVDYSKVDADVARKKQAKAERHERNARQQIEHYLQEGNVAAAAALHRKMREIGSQVALERAELAELIQGLNARQEWAAAAPVMAEFVRRFPTGADGIRIKLAQICVTQLERPARALELLDQVDFAKQAEEKRQLAKKLLFARESCKRKVSTKSTTRPGSFRECRRRGTRRRVQLWAIMGIGLPEYAFPSSGPR